MHRGRKELRIFDVEVLSVEAERLPAPEPGQHLEPLVEPLGPDPVVGLLAEYSTAPPERQPADASGPAALTSAEAVSANFSKFSANMSASWEAWAS